MFGSYGSRSFLSGDKWYDFLSDTRAVLGSPSGSNVNVKNRKIAEKVSHFLRTKNNFYDALEVIPASCKNKDYTGISPRNFEAAFLETLQILVYGEYGKNEKL